MNRLTIYFSGYVTLTLDLTLQEIEFFETMLCNPTVTLFEGETKHVVITENILMYTVWGEE